MSKTLPRPIAASAHPAPFILRLDDVCRRIGIGKSTLYNLIKDEGFPPPVRIGKKISGWREELVSEWIELRQVGVSQAPKKSSGDRLPKTEMPRSPKVPNRRQRRDANDVDRLARGDAPARTAG